MLKRFFFSEYLKQNKGNYVFKNAQRIQDLILGIIFQIKYKTIQIY